jgi:hypothetical protein
MAIALGNGFTWDVVKVKFDDGGDFLNDLLNFLASGEVGWGDLEKVDHTVWEDDHVDLKVDVLMHEGFDVADISFDANILKNVYGQVDDLRLF